VGSFKAASIALIANIISTVYQRYFDMFFKLKILLRDLLSELFIVGNYFNLSKSLRARARARGMFPF